MREFSFTEGERKLMNHFVVKDQPAHFNIQNSYAI